MTEATDRLNIMLSRLEYPFNYSITFMGNGYYSSDGQLWGVNEVIITKSKTSFCINLKRAEDVHNFRSICFIRSMPELQEKLIEISKEYNAFFENFGCVTVY